MMRIFGHFAIYNISQNTQKIYIIPLTKHHNTFQDYLLKQIQNITGQTHPHDH